MTTSTVIDKTQLDTQVPPAVIDPSDQEAHVSRSPTRGRIVQNALVLSVGQPINWVTAALLAVILPRYLGDENFGRVSLVYTLTSMIGLFVAFGTGTLLTKEVARNGRRSNQLVLNALMLRLPLGLMAIALSMLVVMQLGYDQLTTQLIVLGSIAMVLSVMGGVLGGALQGMQEMLPVMTVQAMTKVIALAALLLLFFLDVGVAGIFISDMVAFGFSLCALLYVVRRRGLLGGRVDPRTWPSLLTGGIPFLTWEAALLVYARVDILLLTSLTNYAVVGWYAAAYRLITIPGFIPSIVIGATFPALAQTGYHDRTIFVAIARRAFRVIALGTIPISIGCITLADQFVTLLGYPDEFMAAIPLVMILSIQIPFVGIDMVIGSCVYALDRQRPWAFAALAAAIFNLIANLALIPATQGLYGNGAIGASISTVVTEVVVMSIGLGILRGDVLGRTDLLFALRCVLAGGAMALVLWQLHGLPVPMVVTIGALVYFVVSLSIGTVTFDDIRALKSCMLTRIRVRTAPAV
jgi:O-antigen/teichoic acid export membrane protein